MQETTHFVIVLNQGPVLYFTMFFSGLTSLLYDECSGIMTLGRKSVVLNNGYSELPDTTRKQRLFDK